MKSTEHHWSTGDESELSKAIGRVKDPLSAPCSTSERVTPAAQEGAAAPPQAKGGEGTHVQIHLRRYQGVKSDKTQMSDSTKELFVVHLGLFGILTVD